MLKLLLYPFSMLYGLVMSIRNFFYDKGWFASVRFNVPVICVGNITVGGTGKTPHTEYIIRLLQSKGKSVAVLSRGYGRKTKGFLEVKVDSCAQMVGDEPLQIKQKFKEVLVAVCEDRVAGINKILEGDDAPDLIILDDAYQHRAVDAQTKILLIDYNRPITKDTPFPGGRLREFASGRYRADIIIYTKCPPELSVAGQEQILSNIKAQSTQEVYFSKMAYQQVYCLDGYEGTELSSFEKVIMLSGIAQPSPFRTYLQKHTTLVDELIFADHHNFSDGDIAKIEDSLASFEGAVIITTEKDMSRLKSLNLPKTIRTRIYYIPIEVEFLPLAYQPCSFDEKLLEHVAKN